jgi:hypothetical protein
VAADTADLVGEIGRRVLADLLPRHSRRAAPNSNRPNLCRRWRVVVPTDWTTRRR